MIGHITEAKRPVRGNASFAAGSGAEQGDRQARERPEAKAQQDLAAIQQLQQQHAKRAARREQSPEPRHHRRARGVGIVAVILREELGDPVGGSLLGADVHEDADKEQQHDRLS